MGSQCGCESVRDQIKAGEILLKNFKFVKLMKKGTLSDVWKVKAKGEKYFALKMTKKVKLSSKGIISMVIKEKNIMQYLSNPFLTNLITAFQDTNNLFLLIEYMPNGTLRQLMEIKSTFSQTQTKFCIISILLGLQYLHLNGVVHMDIKPENVLIDSHCYFRLCDFGLSEFIQKNKLQQITGTYGYQPPELFLNDQPKKKKISFMIDFYGVGVICYELLSGYNNSFRNMFSPQKIGQLLTSKNVSPSCVDFILKLIEENPKERLGNEGFQSIWEHPWLKMSSKQLRQYKKKVKKSFVSESQLKVISQNSKMNQKVGWEEDYIDELYCRLLMKEAKFQKQFDSFEVRKIGGLV